MSRPGTRFAACLALLALALVPSIAFAASDLVVKESRLSVKDTIDALAKA